MRERVVEEGVTRREDEVWQACSSLFADSKKIDLKNIQDFLEDKGYPRGSPNYVYKYRKSWAEQHGMSAHELEEYNKNQEYINFKENQKSVLPHTLLKSFEAYFLDLKKAIKSEYQSQLEEANLKIEGLIVARDSYKDELDKAFLQLKKVGNQKTELAEKFSHLEKQLQQAIESEKIAKKQIEVQEKMLLEIKEQNELQVSQIKERYNSQIQQLQVENNNLRNEHKIERDQLLSQQEKQRHEYIVKVDNLNEENRKLNKQYNEAANSIQKLEIEKNNIKRQYETVSQICETEKQENSKLNKTINELREKLAGESAAQRVINEQMLKIESKLEQSIQRNRELEVQVESMRAEIKQLRIQSKSSKNK